MAIALPAYQDYTVRARVSMAYQESAPVREHLRQYYLGSGEWPASLEEAGYYLPTRGEVIETMYLDADQDLVIRRGVGGRRVLLHALPGRERRVPVPLRQPERGREIPANALPVRQSGKEGEERILLPPSFPAFVSTFFKLDLE